MPETNERYRSNYVQHIIDMLDQSSHRPYRLSVQYAYPWTFVRINTDNMCGFGKACVGGDDPWDKEEGKRIAVKRAARDFVDNYMRAKNITIKRSNNGK